ncbi:MAG: glutathione-disulfide reductase [Pseudohongiellaceae bacterium]|nr:glutathione-disulfide reductase [Pseudohongiellaceae bacterium]
MSDFDYDLFVIGGGSGGVRAARVAATLGARVGLAEGERLGGTCVNVGCIPKKLFSYASHYSADFEDAQSYGWEQDVRPKMNWQTLKQNKDTEILRLNGIYQGLLENSGVEIFSHFASFVDEHTLKVGDQNITAQRILIATGGTPFVPEFPGSEHAITSNEAFALESLPERICIVGAGYIAVEFAGIMAGLGVETTLIHRGSKLLKEFDAELGELLIDEMSRYAELKLNTEITSIEKNSNGALVCELNNGSTLETDCVLYATGRIPNTKGLGLDKLAVTVNKKGAVEVDEEFCTQVDNIFAVGDVINRMALTPVALAEGQILVNRLYAEDGKRMDYSNIPTAIFSHPNIATVGLDEKTAREQYTDIKVFKSKFRALKHTLSKREEKTFMKLIVDASTDKVIGAHMLGADSAEIIQGIAIAIKAGATKQDFDNTIGIHPSSAEEFVTMRTPV